MVSARLRELLGRKVRLIWLEWAARQPDAGEHPSWLLPWEKLTPREREVDMLIAEHLYETGFNAAVRRARKAIDTVRPG